MNYLKSLVYGRPRETTDLQPEGQDVIEYTTTRPKTYIDPNKIYQYREERDRPVSGVYEKPVYEEYYSEDPTRREKLSRMPSESEPVHYYYQERAQKREMRPTTHETKRMTSQMEVETRQRPPVVREEIRAIEREEIQPIIYREREQTQIETVTQPIIEKTERPVLVEEKVLPAKEYVYKEPESEEFRRRYQEEIDKFKPSVTVAPIQREVIEKEPIVKEHTVTRRIEEIQPVVYREVVQPKVIRELKPIYERIVEPPLFSPVDLPVPTRRERHESYYYKMRPTPHREYIEPRTREMLVGERRHMDRELMPRRTTIVERRRIPEETYRTTRPMSQRIPFYEPSHWERYRGVQPLQKEYERYERVPYREEFIPGYEMREPLRESQRLPIYREYERPYSERVSREYERPSTEYGGRESREFYRVSGTPRREYELSSGRGYERSSREYISSESAPREYTTSEYREPQSTEYYERSEPTLPPRTSETSSWNQNNYDTSYKRAPNVTSTSTTTTEEQSLLSRDQQAPLVH